MRLAAKVDASQPDIVLALRRCGVKVAVTSGLGNGFPDLVCCYRKRVTMLEVKEEGEKLTPAQVDFHADFPVCVVRSIDDALLVLGIVS